MLSSEGGDLGLAESGASISLISEGVLGLLALLAFLDGPRDGLHMVENAFRQVSMPYSGSKGHREELCMWTRVFVQGDCSRLAADRLAQRGGESFL